MNDSISQQKKATKLVIKYKECLRNHAASLGGNATDGCGEFMPSGHGGEPDGSAESLICSACNCHRNFHRKQFECEEYHSNNITTPPFCCFHNPYFVSSSSQLPKYPYHQEAMVSNKSGSATVGSSECDDDDKDKDKKDKEEEEGEEEEDDADMAVVLGTRANIGNYSNEKKMKKTMTSPSVSAKKRFRTKFSTEQKEKLLRFAEKAGWRIQKLEESVVQQFCQEIGIQRRVLKVWMHNNKLTFSNKTNADQNDDK